MGDNQQEAWEKYPVALPRDTILAGRYIIKDVLGQGGFGITYLAEDHKKKVNVAIKEFFPEGMVTRQSATSEVRTYTDERLENFRFGMQTFLDEAKVLAEFKGNQNIVDVQGYFEENGTAYFVMDYIEGIDFKTYLREHGGSLSWDETWVIMKPVMEALHIAHQKGIIHRDVAPDNIFITKNNTIKLIDFGAARYSLGERSQSLDVILKPGYTPKEQYVRRGRQGPFTDVYSVAACFYAALSGYLPPESLERMEEDNLVPLSTRGVKLPQTAEAAILKGLEVRAEDRFQSMDEFKKAIIGEDSAAQQTPVSQQQPSPAAPLPVPVSKKKKWIIIPCCAAAAAATLLLLVTGLSGPKDTASGVTDTPVLNEVQNSAEDPPSQEGSVDHRSENENKAIKQKQINIVDAYLDVYCKDDPTNYINLDLGTADEAHALHDSITDYILKKMLSEDLYAEYGDFCRDDLNNALAKAYYSVTDIEEKADGSLAVTLSYKPMKFFENVEIRYGQSFDAEMQVWLNNPEVVPRNADTLTFFVLSELFTSMMDTAENIEYGPETSEVIDLENLDGFVLAGFLDMDKLVPYAEQMSDGFRVRGYGEMPYLNIWNEGVAALGAWDDNGYMTGEGIYVWSDGAIYVGSWQNGKRNGYGVLIETDGNIYKGIWEDDMIAEQ